jgi:RNA polymerase sigma-70 factor (ECF subfamily)
VACIRARLSSSITAVDRYREGVVRSDDELLRAWHAGDVKSGDALWRRHSNAVLRFFRNKVPLAVAPDLAQRTIEHALRLETPVRSFRNYVLGIARHQLFDYLRGEQRKSRRTAELETMVIDDAAPTAETWVSAKREQRILLHALRRMPLAVQVTLELQYWERMSASEIASVLELPLGTVKSRIASGKTALRHEITRLTSLPERLKTTEDSLDKWASRLWP